jgi:hypothetical protein
MTTKIIKSISTQTKVTTYQSCDSCIARARYKAIFSFGELDFCLHHFKKHEAMLIKAAQSISPIGGSDEN